MDMEIIEKYRKAGRIAGEVLKYGAALIKPGARLLHVLNKIEEKILNLGGEMAFPPQISMDAIAAHYCADPDDPIIFKDQVASLDIGVHVDGYIGDTAGHDSQFRGQALKKGRRGASKYQDRGDSKRNEGSSRVGKWDVSFRTGCHQ